MSFSSKVVPINKGNYSLDTAEREAEFHKKLACGWEAEYKKYRGDWSELPKRLSVREYPLLVDIELSSVCNLKCPMCYTITDKFKEKVNTTRMEYGLFVKLIDEIAGKVPAVRLSLRGEPTLHKNFIDCVTYAKSKGVGEVSFLTHGGKLTLQLYQKLVEAGADWITVSIDGVGGVYESIRKPLKFDKLVLQLREIAEWRQSNNIDKPVIKIQGVWPAIRVNPDKYYEIFAAVSDLVAFNPLIDYLQNDSELELIEDFCCPQQYQRLVIGADGLVMKCSNDEENEEVIGDVTKESVSQVWHGQKMREIRALHLRGEALKSSSVCRKCYLPRQTYEERCSVGGREIIVHQYTNRIQTVGL